MIFVTHALPVNVAGEPELDRSAVWDGLVLKANNALPFVPSMTYCEVTERYSDTIFDRDIDFRGERFTERITLERPHRVTFTRIAGPVLGTIANEIEGPDDDLKLRFSFALVVAGVEGGSAREREYADSMTGDYLKAVAATLNAMRRIAEGARPRSPRRKEHSQCRRWHRLLPSSRRESTSSCDCVSPRICPARSRARSSARTTRTTNGRG